MSRFGSNSDEDDSGAGIDLSPLIDCVFILLIFFIVTTTFVEETGVEVDKPQATSATNLEKTSILIAVTAEGQVVYGGQEISLAGIRPLVQRFVQKDPATPVIIQADKASQSGTLVRVIDEAKLGGAQKVSLSTAKVQG
jgi:biopolymer transport protein ExbD